MIVTVAHSVHLDKKSEIVNLSEAGHNALENSAI
ncbi:hypothetical protein FBZ94_101548 [Bradyrhizobium sacchari]|uniref:Uncharacterized protein n=1 Tax=Bradyrhizobium sacchari TaxID=1399419 RepID=A0A560KLK4_9BRAD|nr:hypothetical protein FBZ94_101548 [Bradyrhizobium sacchari]TWB84105.1 hypothetical protein FBZ95_101548 [Bradyrhizobium sacchari]